MAERLSGFTRADLLTLQATYLFRFAGQGGKQPHSARRHQDDRVSCPGRLLAAHSRRRRVDPRQRHHHSPAPDAANTRLDHGPRHARAVRGHAAPSAHGGGAPPRALLRIRLPVERRVGRGGQVDLSLSLAGGRNPHASAVQLLCRRGRTLARGHPPRRPRPPGFRLFGDCGPARPARSSIASSGPIPRSAGCARASASLANRMGRHSNSTAYSRISPSANKPRNACARNGGCSVPSWRTCPSPSISRMPRDAISSITPPIAASRRRERGASAGRPSSIFSLEEAQRHCGERRCRSEGVRAGPGPRGDLH